MPCATRLLAFLLVSAAAPAAAQEPTPPTPVDSLAWVQVQQRFGVPRQVTGALVAADSRSVALRPYPDAEPTIVPLAELEWMRVSRGALTPEEGRQRGMRNGLLVGLGFTAALLVGATLTGDECDSCMFDGRSFAVLFGVPLTATAMLVGASSGAARPGERWERVRTPVVLRSPHR